MNKLNKIFYTTIVQSQAWVSLCLALFIWFYQCLGSLYIPSVIWLGYFSTLLAYNLAYWVDQKAYNWRFIVLLISLLFTVYFFLKLENIATQLVVLLAGIISLLYSNPLGSFKLRKVPKFKILWIALVWMLTILLSYIEAGIVWHSKVIFIAISAFLFIVGITIPFDIRDFATDPNGLQTIPQQIGLRRSKWIAMVLLLLSWCSLFWVNHLAFNLVTIAFGLTIGLGILLIIFQKKTNTAWYTAFWIEALSALPFVFFKILSYLIS